MPHSLHRIMKSAPPAGVGGRRPSASRAGGPWPGPGGLGPGGRVARWPGSRVAWVPVAWVPARRRAVGTDFPLIYQRTFVHILYFNFTRRSGHFDPTDN